MMADEWMLTGDTIKFSDAGLLRDGQNRLRACQRAGVPFRTHIVFGIEDEAFDRLDQGKNRNGADVLSIAGYQYVTALSGAVRWTHLIETGRAKSRDSSPQRIFCVCCASATQTCHLLYNKADQSIQRLASRYRSSSRCSISLTKRTPKRQRNLLRPGKAGNGRASLSQLR
jgi:hypothetical protein